MISSCGCFSFHGARSNNSRRNYRLSRGGKKDRARATYPHNRMSRGVKRGVRRRKDGVVLDADHANLLVEEERTEKIITTTTRKGKRDEREIGKERRV